MQVRHQPSKNNPISKVGQVPLHFKDASFSLYWWLEGCFLLQSPEFEANKCIIE